MHWLAHTLTLIAQKLLGCKFRRTTPQRVDYVEAINAARQEVETSTPGSGEQINAQS
jgi:hypothetical protein